MAGHGGAVIAVLVVLALVNSVAAKNYVINPPGSNSGGWTYLNQNLTYDDLFKTTTLFVGDNLTFTFSSSVHDLYEVTPVDVAGCNSANPIHTYTQTVTVTLDSAGQHAFLCSFPNHCSVYGMHLLVTVDAPVGPVGSPSYSPEAGVDGLLTGEPAPAPENAASFLQSGSAMIVGALIAACAVLAL